MKERNLQSVEKNINLELERLKAVNSFVSITLLTLDLAIPVNIELLDKFPLGIDGWQKFDSKEIALFSQKFENALGKPLEEYVRESKDFRAGGAIYITQKTLQELLPEKEGVCIAPTGIRNGGDTVGERLTQELIIKRDFLQAKPEFNLGGRLPVSWTASKGIPPFILSLHYPEGRSMVLIKDEQEVKVKSEVISRLTPPHLLLLDARDLTQASYLEEGIRFARDPKNFVVLSLGTESIMDQLVNKIKLLHAYTQREAGFAGNRGEVESLLKNWGGITNLSEFMFQTKLRFLLETNGKNGAEVHFRIGDTIHSAAFVIPENEVFNGDTTNAGDFFLAFIIKGLMDGPKENQSPEDWLYGILEDASKGTLKKLKERN